MNGIAMVLAAGIIIAVLFVPIIPVKHFWTVRYYSVAQLYLTEQSNGGCFIDTLIKGD